MHIFAIRIIRLMAKTSVIFCMWFPGRVGIRGNEAAKKAAEEALKKESIDDLIPFSDLKPLTTKYIHQVWQKEWDEAFIVSNKLHDILPKLSDKLLTFCNTREEDSSKQTSCWTFLFHALLSIERRRASCLCSM